jgi:putative solute:sodium symporter small subunit
MTSDPAKKTTVISRVSLARSSYWRHTQRLTAQLLLVWLAVTLGTIFFARELSDLTFFGWPFSFYMAAQGATLIYLIIVGVYAWRMRHFDKTDNDLSDVQ